jgi:hypothetical protein
MRAGSSYRRFAVLGLVIIPIAAIGGWSCGNSNTQTSTFGGGGNGSGAGLGNGGNGNGGGISTSSSPTASSTGPGGDPTNCAEAAKFHTYIGCDFWPTVTANAVWSIFDYAVVIANTGDAPANVTVQRGGATVQTVTVPPNALNYAYLPWVSQLKGPDNVCGTPEPFTSSIMVTGGAYQFSALEYSDKGGPPGKDWSSCPANQCGGGLSCLSYSNDASLLLPSTAMTGNYRIVAYPSGPLGTDLTITATEDSTQVKYLPISGAGPITGGMGVTVAGDGSVTLTMNAGDVAELVSTSGDISGGLVQANKPVQVITGVPCLNVPASAGFCDHVEESVFPAETLGSHYFVSRLSAPGGGTPVGQEIRIFGNVDGTNLTYPAGNRPTKATDTINAGQVVDLGIVDIDFEIKGDHEFAIGTWMQGSSVVDPSHPQNPDGDPSQSLSTAVEQYREKYVFLAPTDYDENYVDVIAPLGSNVSVDTAVVPTTLFTAIGGSTYGVAHLKLTAGNGGAHELISNKPAGIQVVGYGAQTSYQYPGGLNLGLIAPPPPVPK